MPRNDALILFAHGARDPEWAAPLRAMRERVLAREPGRAVELAFLEFMEPSLAEAVSRFADAGHRGVTVAPIFIAQGGHLKNDLPKLLDALRERHPGLEIRLLPPLGDAGPVLDAIAGWLVDNLPR